MKNIVQTPENEKGAALDADWKFATEAMRRKIISDPKVRETFSGLADAPVEEQLATKAISMVAGEDPFLNRVAESRSNLTDFLNQEPLPDDVLRPDITTAYFNHQNSGGLEGITAEEHERIARKYRFARDIKLPGVQDIEGSRVRRSADQSRIRSSPQAVESHTYTPDLPSPGYL